ncbi:hypothetical protein PoB_004541100 [Plakobranchus ocellatus]|uniref:Uncharacterized protein n=1 Tax=Plakobranchus ocellatus TaxID=259542 RepID=A0AAV4BER3_9GAST|nr:hypothetical protein PoB_004541100 [Plakobranchus ocellatus]
MKAEWKRPMPSRKENTRQQLTRTSRRQEGELQVQQYTSHQRGTDEDRGHLSGVLAMHRILGVSIPNDEETICCNDLGASYTQDCTNYI